MDARQSTFVTVLAWMVIVFAGISTFVGLLQSAFVSAFMPPLSESEMREMPAMARLLFANFHWFVYGNTVFAAIALASGIGLLKRKEWARQVMIGMLVLLAVVSAAAAVGQQVMVNAFLPEGSDASPDVHSMILVMRIAGAIFGLAFVAVHAWLAVRLNSPPIRAEFQPH